MTNTAEALAPIRKTITVKASRRSRVQGLHRWLRHVVAALSPHRQAADGEGRHRIARRGPMLGREADGTECDWGRVLTWEPPNRFVLAWQIGPTWQYEPDLNKASEVEVRFHRGARRPDAGGPRTPSLRAARRRRGERQVWRGYPEWLGRPAANLRRAGH